MSSQAICSLCSERKAEVFCQCVTPEVQLCQGCVGTHILRNPRSEHIPRPITHLKSYKLPGFSPILRLRIETFPQVRDFALRSVAEIDRATERYTEAVNKVCEQLTLEYNTVISELQQVKNKLQGEVSAAIEEVERTLMDEQPKLTAVYSAAFRWLSENFMPFHLFTYQLLPPNYDHRVHFDYKVHTPEDMFPREKYPFIYFQTMWEYDFTSQTTSQHPLTVNFKWGGSFVEIDWYNLMCIGTHPASRDAYILNLSSYQMNKIDSLTVNREGPGAAKANNCIYLFGGIDSKYLISCEKWELSSLQWRAISNMHYPKSHFTPCLYRELMYLVAASNEPRVIETFRPESEEFTVLSVKLPEELAVGFMSVTFIVFGELWMLTAGKQLVRWRVKGDRGGKVAWIDRDCYSTQSPLLLGSDMLIACKGKLLKFNIVTNTFASP